MGFCLLSPVLDFFFGMQLFAYSWKLHGYILEVPRVRLSISGVKSGTNPEAPRKRSQSKFWFSKFRTVGDPKTLENKWDSLPRLISELCYPQYGWYPFPFLEGPSSWNSQSWSWNFLTVLGAPLNIGRTPTGARNNAPFSEGFLEGFLRLLSRRF